jgi:3-mercaptopyruvate sulfurtransferase SseA
MLLMVALIACQSPASTSTETPLPTQPDAAQQTPSLPPLTEADVPRIEVKEAKAALDSGQAILVDVRSTESYAAGHAEGAISIPLTNFQDDVSKLSLKKSQWIITYCT